MEYTTSRQPTVSFNGLFDSAVMLAAVVSLLSFLSPFWWLFDLFTHFRLQYVVLFGFATLVFLWRKYWIRSFCLALLCAVNSAVLLPWWSTQPEVRSSQKTTLRMMVFNVNTRGDPQKAVAAIRRVDPDLLLLMEIDQHWLSSIAPVVAALSHTIVQTRSDNFGIGFFSRWPLTGAIVQLGPAQLPSVQAQITIGDDELHFLGTHPPPPIGSSMTVLRDKQLQAVAGLVTNTHPSIVAGDLNTTPYGRSFKALLKTSGLKDSSVSGGVQGTWPVSSNLLSIPLDHFLYGGNIAVIDRQVIGDTGSDHSALVVDFAL